MPQFAKTYAGKTSTPYEKWVQRLWGEEFLDLKTGKWQKSKTNDNVRGFVKFIYEPIMNMIQAAMNDQKDKLFAMCDKLGVSSRLSAADRELTAKPLMKRVMQVSGAGVKGCGRTGLARERWLSCCTVQHALPRALRERVYTSWPSRAVPCPPESSP